MPGHAHVPTRYARGTGWRVSIAALLVALTLGIGFVVVHGIKAHQAEELDDQTAGLDAAAPVVDVFNVNYAPATQLFSLPGQARAWFESTIYARVDGYIAPGWLDIGDKVKGGTVMATIETPELDAQLLAAQAKLKAAEAQVVVAQATTDFAKSTYFRWKDSPKGVVSEQEREEKKAEFDSSVARLNAAQAQVNLAKAEVDNLTTMTNFKEVRSPYDGVITARRIDTGDLVTAGSSANTGSLYTVAQSDQIRIFVDVPQAASSQISVNMTASIRANDYSDRQFKGTVTRTANAIDPATKTLRVEVDVDNKDMALLPGMYVQVSFELKPKSLLQVPASALIFRSSGPQVGIVGPDSRIIFHDVTIARDQGEMVELGSGVSLNDKVALNLSSQIGEGDLVSVNEKDKPSSARTPETPSHVSQAAP
jgi:RND family efflux transporter MFP subunit